MNDKIFLDKEFDKFFSKLENGENFTLLRYGDGERAIMCGKKVHAQEGWESPEYISKLGYALLDTLNVEQDNFYYGISCPCCDRAAYYWYSTRIKSKNKTFANLWVNSNYEKFFAKFSSIKRDVVLIANYRAKGCKIANLNILKHYEVGDDCISFWENEASDLINKIKKDFGKSDNLLYVVAAGPMSEPIITELYKNNPNNCYIDFGSSIDMYIHKKQTRPYMDKTTKYSKQKCWMDNPYTCDFDVSVVLNLYKRPENLEIQLEALEKQTLKPKEILLYQDGTGDIIEIPKLLKERFNVIEISPENRGVWARFDFAKRTVKTKYTCVFDDDTIPGSRWLENCHSNMNKQEGLFGTIGIIMNRPEKYPLNRPYASFFRVGWDGNLDETVEVDFVGHSWFFKSEWLKDLFEAPREIQKYKLAGEDMAFSYQLLKKGIKTFIPPHPKEKFELFGSIPELARKFGTNKAAISIDNNNLNIMREAIGILLKNDWQTLSKRRPQYIREIEHRLSIGSKGLLFGLIKIETTATRIAFIIFGIRISLKRKK